MHVARERLKCGQSKLKSVVDLKAQQIPMTQYENVDHLIQFSIHY